MIHRLHIPFKLPGLNEYVRSCRGNKYQAARMKRDVEAALAWYINRLPVLRCPITINFVWTEGNRRRDLDNVAFAKKFILDALVKCGKIADDDRRHVAGFSDAFRAGEEFGVDIEIIEEETGDDTD